MIGCEAETVEGPVHVSCSSHAGEPGHESHAVNDSVYNAPCVSRVVGEDSDASLVGHPVSDSSCSEKGHSYSGYDTGLTDDLHLVGSGPIALKVKSEVGGPAGVEVSDLMLWCYCIAPAVSDDGEVTSRYDEVASRDGEAAGCAISGGHGHISGWLAGTVVAVFDADTVG